MYAYVYDKLSRSVVTHSGLVERQPHSWNLTLDCSVSTLQRNCRLGSKNLQLSSGGGGVAISTSIFSGYEKVGVYFMLKLTDKRLYI